MKVMRQDQLTSFKDWAIVLKGTQQMDGFTKGVEYLAVSWEDGNESTRLTFFQDDHGRNVCVPEAWNKNFEQVQASEEDIETFYEIEIAAARVDHPYLQP